MHALFCSCLYPVIVWHFLTEQATIFLVCVSSVWVQHQNFSKAPLLQFGAFVSWKFEAFWPFTIIHAPFWQFKQMGWIWHTLLMELEHFADGVGRAHFFRWVTGGPDLRLRNTHRSKAWCCDLWTTRSSSRGCTTCLCQSLGAFGASDHQTESYLWCNSVTRSAKANANADLSQMPKGLVHGFFTRL